LARTVNKHQIMPQNQITLEQRLFCSQDIWNNHTVFWSDALINNREKGKTRETRLDLIVYFNKDFQVR